MLITRRCATALQTVCARDGLVESGPALTLTYRTHVLPATSMLHNVIQRKQSHSLEHTSHFKARLRAQTSSSSMLPNPDTRTQ